MKFTATLALALSLAFLFGCKEENKCGEAKYNPETQFCGKEIIRDKYSGNDRVYDHIYDKCEGKEYDPEMQSCINEKLYNNKCKGQEYNPETHFCYNDSDIVDKCEGKEYNTVTQFCYKNTLYNGTITDTRDEKVYRIIKIGEQVWMAENLNYNEDGSKYYNNDQINFEEYGRLYNWETAKKACPNGWHLPSKDDWNVLVNSVGGKDVAGNKLKAKSGWNDYNGKSGNGTDDYGFAAMPGGNYTTNGGFDGDVGSFGKWWSASASDDNNAYELLMGYCYNYAGWNSSYKIYLNSVRCVKD